MAHVMAKLRLATCNYSNTAQKTTWKFVRFFTVATERRHGKHGSIKKDKTSFVSCSDHRIFFSRI